MSQTESWTIGRLLTWTTDYLRGRGCESARLDAEVLLATARGCERIDLYTAFDQVADDEHRSAFRELVRRRGEGTPVAYLVGRREFFSLSFRVTPDVLIPRPETELIVVALLDRIKASSNSAPISIADVTANSGHQGAVAKDGDRTYKIFQTATASVEYCVGEFYWKVNDGQRTRNTDYICPPYILSREATDGEVNWSRGRYLTHAEINGCTDCVVPVPVTNIVGANQPYKPKDIYAFWGIAFAVAVLLVIGVKMRQADAAVYQETLPLSAQVSLKKSEM